MTVLIVLAALVACCYALDRLTAAPAARGVRVSARLAEARRIAAGSAATDPVRRTRGPRSSAIRRCRRATSLR
jgi:hypothetical protein